MKTEFVEKFLEEVQTKKISVNLDGKTLSLVDDLSKIVGTTRTNIITALIGYGTKKFIGYLEKTWENMKKDKRYDKKILDTKLNELNKFREKHEIEGFP